MPLRTEFYGYGVVASAIDHGRFWQGVAYIFGPDKVHVRTIEAKSKCANLVDAEAHASTLGQDFVWGLLEATGGESVHDVASDLATSSYDAARPAK